MLAKLIALLVLCSVLTGLGQDRLKPTSYARGLEQQPVRGRTIGVTDGDTIKVLTAAKQKITVRIAFVDAPEKGQPFGQEPKRP
jgi:endonuclease YncB( thermonuclease family)